MLKLHRPPFLVRMFFVRRKWRFSVSDQSIFLTFDDGPSPLITPFVLDELAKRNIKATFFCVGENVQKYPELYQRILHEGHQVGNHSFSHTHAWKEKKSSYLKNIDEAAHLVESNLFRPPYGRLPFWWTYLLTKKYKVIMWTWLSYDFDKRYPIENIIQKAAHIKKGDILVLHDNAKIADRQKELLPTLLDYLIEKGFQFKLINAVL